MIIFRASDLIFHVKDGIEKRFSDGFSHVIEFFSFAFRAAGVLGVIITKNISTGMILLLLFVSLGTIMRLNPKDCDKATSSSNCPIASIFAADILLIAILQKHSAVVFIFSASAICRIIS